MTNPPRGRELKFEFIEQKQPEIISNKFQKRKELCKLRMYLHLV